MKLTTKGRYAVMAMADLATNANVSSICLTDISSNWSFSISVINSSFVLKSIGRSFLVSA